MTARFLCPTCQTPQNTIADGTVIPHQVPDRWRDCAGAGRRPEHRVDDPDRPGYPIASISDAALVDVFRCHLIHTGWRVTDRDGYTLQHADVATGLLRAITAAMLPPNEEES